MKTIKILFAAVLIFSAQFIFAQSKSYKMFDSFSGKDGITNFTFTKNMIDMIDLDLGDDGDEKQVTGDLHEIRFMSYNPEKGEMSGADFSKTAIAQLPKSAYKKFETEDNDDDVEIWLLGGKNKFQECHVFTTNNEPKSLRMVVSFYGDFTVSDLERLKKTGKDFSDKEN